MERQSPRNLFTTSPKLLDFSHSPATSPVTPGSLSLLPFGKRGSWMQDFTVFLGVQSAPSPFLGLAQRGAGELGLHQAGMVHQAGMELAPALCSQRGREGNSSQTYQTTGRWDQC